MISSLFNIGHSNIVRNPYASMRPLNILGPLMSFG